MSKNIILNTRVPQGIAQDVRSKVDSGEYLNISDYLRQALREKLERDREA